MKLGKISVVGFFVVFIVGQAAFCSFALGADPWADQVISYQAGSNIVAGYDNPATTIGEPSRYTPDATWGDSDVTMFSSAWKPDQVVSIGAGGHLVVKFDQPVEDDVDNPYGIDLLVFGNAGFIDAAWPGGTVGGLSNEPGLIEVSQDGNLWLTIVDIFADDMWPTQGFIDSSDPYAADGTVPSDLTMPMDPAITLSSVMGQGYADVLAVYDGSGGGGGVDISGTGLSWIQYVRISQDINDEWSTEIAGFSDVTAVPEPASLTILLLGIYGLVRRSKRG